MTIRKIISGGQTGADMGGLKAALELGLETGGTAPKGYNTEEGRRLILKTKYSLSQWGNYRDRTFLNIRDSDGTVIFGNIDSPGSKVTLQGCTHFNKPVIINPPTIDFLQFLEKHQIEILNIAGMIPVEMGNDDVCYVPGRQADFME